MGQTEATAKQPVIVSQLKRVTLKKVVPLNKELGRGSYASVFTVKHNEVIYAAKKIHSILIEDVSMEEKQRIKDDFIQECLCCSNIQHPNIVQFVGVYFQSDQSNFPILVMELMHTSLTKLIDNNKSKISFRTKISILHDVLLGLNFLHNHKPQILHRDLSPNNIMLTIELVAKIGDLGVAKVVRAGSKEATSKLKLTRAVPGTPDFMPPEAMTVDSVYSTPIDIFSFGGITLYVFSEEWPTPSEPKMIDPGTKKLVALSETKRREQYLKKITGKAVELRKMIEQCLDDDPDKRPSIQEMSAIIDKQLLLIYLPTLSRVSATDGEGMNYSIDCSEIITQVELQCIQENRLPTGDEYNFIITQLRSANMQLLQFIIKLQQDKETVDNRCRHLLIDRETNQNIIMEKNQEMEEFEKAIFQKNEEVQSLNAMIEGLKEEASESEKNLKDVLKTYEGLLNHVSSLESALNGKDEQIRTLLTQHIDLLVHKNKENEETIASLRKDLEHQCKLRTYRDVIREPASTSISTDLLSNFNLSQSVSHLSVTEADNACCLSHGKPRSDCRVVKRKITAAAVVNDSMSNITGHQNCDPLQQQHAFKNDDTSKAKKHSLSDDLGLVKCNHLDEEQEAMIGNILHTTKTQLLQCKKMIGNIPCKSNSLYICLSCGVTYCRNHLYECHNREHTIFMKMKTKQIWCFSCKCDPLPSNSLESLNKEKSSKTHGSQRPKSTSQSSSEAAEVAAMSPHNLPSLVPTSTGSTSVTNTTSCSTIGKAFSVRQALNSPSIISSATVTSSNNLSTSYTFSSGIMQDQINSSGVPANNTPPIDISHSNISTVTSDSLPVSAMPTVTKLDTSLTVVREPHIGGKQTINNATSDTKLSSKSCWKSDLMKATINQTIKKIGTTPTTAIVPVVRSLHSNTSFTSSGTLPLMSRSQIAYKSVSTYSTSSTSETKV